MNRMSQALPKPSIPLLSICLSVPAFALTACSQVSWPEREPTVIAAGADSVKVWPPGARYAIPGDPVIVSVRGLRRTYACARLLQIEWLTADSAGARHIVPRARFEVPGVPDCPLASGIDTLLPITAPDSGRLHFRTLNGILTDSLRVIAAAGVVESFLHPPDDSLRIHGRYTFRDSTSGHPRRALYADSLAACEIVHGAVYRRLHGGDTLSVRIRTLLAAPLDTAVFPACAGIHADTVEVVEDVYGYP